MAKKLFSLVMVLLLIGVLNGCGGGGGGTATPGSTTTPIAADGTVTVEGRVSFGPNAAPGMDLTGTFVYIEEVTGGQTATVLGNLAPAKNAPAKAPSMSISVFDRNPDATTDKNGGFRITKVKPGEHVIYAWHASSGLKASSQVTVNRAITNVAEILLTPTGKIGGKVLLKNAVNHAGTMVYIEGTSFATMSDAAGNYIINEVPVRTGYTVVFTRGKYSNFPARESCGSDNFYYEPQYRININVTAGQTTTISPDVVLSQYNKVNPPRVVAISPIANETVTNFHIPAKVQFDKGMDRDSLEAAITFTPMPPRAVRVKVDGTTGSLMFDIKFVDSTGTFVPFEPGKTYSLVISTGATDIFGMGMVANFSTSFVTSNLAIESTSPANGVKLVAPAAAESTFATITFNLPMNRDLTQKAVEVRELANLTGSDVLLPAPSFAWDAEWRTLTLSGVRSKNNSRYTVTVKSTAADRNNVTLSADTSFVFHTAPFAVTSYWPTLGEMGVPRDLSVTFTFNADVDRKTVEEGFKLKKGVTDVVGLFTWSNNRTFTFKPVVILDGDAAEYTMVMPATVVDVNAIPLSQAINSTFRTGNLRVVQSLPVNATAQLPTTICPNVTFSEPVVTGSDYATAGQGIQAYLKLFEKNGLVETPVAVNISMSNGGKTFSLDSLQPLKTGQEYVYKVLPGVVSSVDGKTLQPSEAVAATFTTVPLAVNHRFPQTVHFNTGALQPANHRIEVGFTNKMDKNSVERAFTLMEGTNKVFGQFSWSNADSKVTFTPEMPLKSATTYTARVDNTIARDIYGAALPGAVTWDFVTGGLRVTSIVPVNGMQYVNPASPDINVYFSADIDLATVPGKVLLLDNTVPASPVQVPFNFNYSSLTLTLNPLTPLKVNTSYTVKIIVGASGVKSVTGEQIAAAADILNSFTTSATKVISSVPRNGELFSGSTAYLYFTNEMNRDSVKTGVSVKESVNNSPLSFDVDFSAPNTLVLTFNAPLSPGAVYTIFADKTKVRDIAGNFLVEDFTSNFKVPALNVVSTVPTNLDDKTDPTTSFTINFNYPMNWQTVVAATSLKDAAGVAVPLKMNQFDDTQIIFTTASGLPLGFASVYEVSIVGATAKDTRNNSLGADFKFSFRTTPFTATMISVSPFSTISTVTPSISIGFNAVMKRVETEAAFSLVKDGTATPVAGIFAWNSSGDIMTFTPNVPLDINSKYNIAIENSVSKKALDVNNHALPAFASWFRTGGGLGVWISGISDGDYNVPLNTALTFAFDKPMSKSASIMDVADVVKVTEAGQATNLLTDVNQLYWSGNNLVFTPPALLKPATKYVAVVDAAKIKTITGYTMPANFVCNFTTGNFMVTTTLSNFTTYYSSPLTVSCNYNIDFNTLTAVSVYPEDAPGSPVAGAVKRNNATSFFVEFDPLKFDFNRRYILKINGGADVPQLKDVNANVLPRTIIHYFSLSRTTLSSVSPFDSETGVDCRSDLSFTFSNYMNVESVRWGFGLYKAGLSSTEAVTMTANRNYTDSLDPKNFKSFTFKPNAPLAKNQRYVMLFPAGTLRDFDGRIVNTQDIRVSFYTEKFSLTGIVPSDGATNAACDSTITLTFNDPLNASEVNTKVLLKDNAGASVPFNMVTAATTGSVFMIKPTVSLAAGATYEVSVPSTIVDLTGTQIENSYRSKFKTGGVIVSSVGPAQDSFIDVNTSYVTVNFNVDMDRPSVESAITITENGTTVPVAEYLDFEWGTSFKELQIKFRQILKADSLYAITIAATAKSFGNVSPLAAYTYNLKTKPLNVVQTSPANYTDNLYITSNVNVYFSSKVKRNSAETAFLIESVNPTTGVPDGVDNFTHNDGTFTWYTTTGTYVEYFYFNPVRDLKYGTTYRATVKAGAETLTGKLLGSDYTFIFRTAPASSPSPATVPALSVNLPAANERFAEIVPGCVDLTFNTDMIPQTVDSAFALYEVSVSNVETEIPVVCLWEFWNAKRHVSFYAYSQNNGFKYNQRYRYKLGVSAKAENGLFLPALFTADFATRPSNTLFVTAATYGTGSGAGQCANVSVSTTGLYFQFNNELNNKDLLVNSTYKVKVYKGLPLEKDGTVEIGATSVGVSSGYQLDISLANQLTYGTYYKVVALGGTNGVTDIYGNKMMRDYAMEFTTEKAPVAGSVTKTAMTYNDPLPLYDDKKGDFRSGDTIFTLRPYVSTFYFNTGYILASAEVAVSLVTTGEAALTNGNGITVNSPFGGSSCQIICTADLKPGKTYTLNIGPIAPQNADSYLPTLPRTIVFHTAHLVTEGKNTNFSALQVVPDDNATGVLVDTNVSKRIYATFNGYVDPTSVPGNIKLYEGGIDAANIVPLMPFVFAKDAGYNIESNQVQIYTVNPLKYNRVYVLNISSGIRDTTSGVSLQTGYTYTFKTPPLLKQVNAWRENLAPATSEVTMIDSNGNSNASVVNGSILIAPETTFEIRFNAPSEGWTAVNKIRLVKESDNSTVALGSQVVKQSLTPDTFEVITFRPSAELAAGSYYYLEIPGTIADTFGVNIFNNYRIRFKTSTPYYRFVSNDNNGGVFNNLRGAFVTGTDLYVADAGAYKVYKYNFAGSAWTSPVSKSFGTGDANLNAAQGVAVDTLGNIYVADTGNHRIMKYDSAGTLIAWWGKESLGNVGEFAVGSGKIGGTAGAEVGAFNQPIGLKFDAAGNLYVADSGNHRIMKMALPAKTWSSFAGVAGTSGTTNDKFNTPTDVFVDLTGNVFVADSANRRIQKFDSSAAFQTGFTTGSDTPYSLAVSATGKIVVSFPSSNYIKNYDGAGTLLSTIAEYNGGTGGSAYYPYGVILDALGNLYFSNNYNYRIEALRKIRD